MNHNLQQVKDLENIADWVKRIEPELLSNFVRYWSIRKSLPSIASALINEIKTAGSSNDWLSLIESNHKFRELYGEEKADELVDIIEKNSSA
ncbi:MAG: hypothetical protein HY094_05640 [Candidatus Melainabacteria bacterium]|nr:hypothetical protein [Candidatus Melainabacteria bacterium]